MNILNTAIIGAVCLVLGIYMGLMIAKIRARKWRIGDVVIHLDYLGYVIGFDGPALVIRLYAQYGDDHITIPMSTATRI